MNIDAKKGTKILFTGKGGYDSDKEYANKHLTVDEIYTVDKILIDNWSSTIILEEFPFKSFNTVMFKDIRLAENHHSHVIEELLENKQPRLEDYKDDASTANYINDLLDYIERLKKDQKITVEMLTQAIKEDKKIIKQYNESN